MIDDLDDKTSAAAQKLSRLGASKGGVARAKKLTKAQRCEIASNAARKRWGHQLVARVDDLPGAKYRGLLNLLDIDLPCYVLDNGQRVIGQASGPDPTVFQQ